MTQRDVSNLLRHFLRFVDSVVTKWGLGPTSVTDSVPGKWFMSESLVATYTICICAVA